MSHYIVISVVFAPPCLSTICHTLHMVMTHKLKSCCRFQREGFHACMHTNTHTLHAHTLLCRFAFCVYIVLTEGFCLCFFLFCFCVLLTSHSFPLVKRRQTLNPSWYPLWILITMLFPAGGASERPCDLSRLEICLGERPQHKACVYVCSKSLSLHLD